MLAFHGWFDRPRGDGKPIEILCGIGDVVDAGRVEMQLGDHAPHGFAQERCHLHGRERTGQSGRRRRVEIVREEGFRFVDRKAGIGRQACQIEHCGREAGILEIDQPEPVVRREDVRRKEIVVAEDDRQRLLHRLHFFRQGEVRRQLPASRLFPASSVRA